MEQPLPIPELFESDSHASDSSTSGPSQGADEIDMSVHLQTLTENPSILIEGFLLSIEARTSIQSRGLAQASFEISPL
jgi:hypothetical protein